MTEEHTHQSTRLNLKVTLIRNYDDGIDSFDGQIITLTPGSMGLYTTRPIPPDTRVQIILTFMNSEGREYNESVYASVVWQDIAPPFYLIGAIFPDVNEQDNPNLIIYLSEADHPKSANRYQCSISQSHFFLPVNNSG
jgi:hypothetical protein